MRLRCIIIRKTEDLTPSTEEDKSSVSSNSHKEENMMKKEDKKENKSDNAIDSNLDNSKNYYNLYIIKNSKHFTVSLAEWGLKQLKSEVKFLELSEIESLFNNLKLEKPSNYTWGDILFLINYYSLNTVVDNKIVIKIDQLRRTYYTIINSNKNFDSVFDKWMSELKDKNIEIPWKNFIQN